MNDFGRGNAIIAHYRQTERHGFPVLHAPNGCARFVDVSKLSDEWALRVHSQSLDKLAGRGGLSVKEIRVNIERGQLRDSYSYLESECVNLVNSIKFIAKQ